MANTKTKNNMTHYRALYEFNYMLWRLGIIERHRIRVLHRVILNEMDKEVERENQ